jgi:glycerophosphoryl diester phosphodiesterase
MAAPKHYRPRVNIGHRGAGHLFKHNSYEGFKYIAENAAALDISAIETDLFYTKVRVASVSATIHTV